MSTLSHALILAALVAVAQGQPDSAWAPLFNGEDLDGWTRVDPPLDASVQDGMLVIRMTPHTNRHAFVRTDARYRDFIFEIEFRRDQAMDSGVLFRAQSAPDDAFSALFGYMVKIDPRAERRWTGGVFADFGDAYAWLYPLESDKRAQAAERHSGEWNHLRIEAIGERIKVWLNGVPTAHFIDDRYREGYFALKIHFLNSGSPERARLQAAFRNARVITDEPQAYMRPIDLPAKDVRGEWTVTRFR